MKRQQHYLLVGLPFSGKTVLAKELEKRLGFARVSIDDMKFDFGYNNVSDADVPDETWKQIFAELDRRIVGHLKKGTTLVNEYAWLTKTWRDRAKSLASDLGVETTMIFVDTPEKIVRERWQKNRQTKKRFDVPDDVFEEAIKLFEKPQQDEHVVILKPLDNLEEWIEKNFQ